MPRGVGDNKFALFGREVAIGDINGNALLALRLQAVYQQRRSSFSPQVPWRLPSLCKEES